MSENTGTNTTPTESSISDNGIPEITYELSVSESVALPTDPYLRNAGEPADAKATGDAIANVESSIGDMQESINSMDDRIEALEGSVGDDVVLKSMIKTDLSAETQNGNVADAKATYDTITAAVTNGTAAVKTELETEIGALAGTYFPVGAVYVTTNASMPTAIGGTWTEILIPTTWGDLKNGVRSYGALGASPAARTLHFFLRTA